MRNVSTLRNVRVGAFLASGMLVLLLGGGIVSGCGKPRERVPLQEVGTFRIEAGQPYLRTGFDLVPDMYYLFRHVGGKVCFQGDRRCSAPRGSDLPGEEAWGLQVMVDGQPVPVRDGTVLTVAGPGELVFYLPEGEEITYSDDKLSLYQDNTGHWEVRVEVFSHAPQPDWIQGVSLTSYSAGGYCHPDLQAILKRIQAMGANTVQFVVVFQTDSRSIYPVDYSPRDFCLVQATQAARRLGLRVGWNLHVDPPDNGWRGELQPPDHKTFFNAYREFAVFYAQMAADNHVSFFIPATEMVSLTRTAEDRNRWLSIFHELHSEFFGPITYGADRVELPVLDDDFWNACCDQIGLTAWYSLTSDPHPTATELDPAWNRQIGTLERYAEAAQMRILLVETGYRAIEGCATEPADYLRQARTDELCQVESFKALFKAFPDSRRQLFSGLLIWETTAPGEKLTDYSPLDRVSESIIRQAWTRTR
ncbi:MAG: hypothetical protein FJ109_04215 [Deltaproteobacteria bacterium]|nr:hypothetical protein [Deltaproteobacteria bacterium]